MCSSGTMPCGVLLLELASCSRQMVEERWSLELRRSEPTASLHVLSAAPLIKLELSGDLGTCGGGGRPRLLRLHGASDEKEGAAVAVDGSGWPHGSLLLQLGESHMADEISRHDPWLEGQPLQAPSLALLQPPARRPCGGLVPAFFGLVAPSGVVPGGSKGGRSSSSDAGGGAEGPDRVFLPLTRVLLAKNEDCVVILYFLCVLCTLYPHRQILCS